MANKKAGLWLAVLGICMLVLSACQSVSPTIEPTPTKSADPFALPRVRGSFFSTSGECAYCHTGMRDDTGKDVSIDSAWRSSMMANSTRDPYYRASVRSEVVNNPEHQAVIEKKCSICHIGMAYHTAEQADATLAMLPGGGFLDPANEYHALAIDGVSCSLCHQITSTNLGKMDSFSGGYDIDLTSAQGTRTAYGFFTVDAAIASIMTSTSGFTPQQSDHVKRSEICAVCHNLFTPYITNEGELSTDLFPEQTPQLEWKHSAFATEKTCQDCHMPHASGDVILANTGSPARNPFPQHVFAGGNVYMLSLLSANGEDLQVTANDDQFEITRNAVLDLLQQQTATLGLTTAQAGGILTTEVDITVKTGHKFPTSFPSRRAWLHLIVKDAAGSPVFESGGWQPDGVIIGNDNDAAGDRFEKHYDLITSSDQVQIYEAIIGDPDGKLTTTLLRAKAYLKDNRLLPVGFDKQTAGADIAVYGLAVEDANFTAGSDQVTYQIPITPGVYTVEVELLYQSIGFRWAEKFRSEQNPEGTEFYGYADGMGNPPVVITSQTIVVDIAE